MLNEKDIKDYREAGFTQPAPGSTEYVPSWKELVATKQKEKDPHGRDPSQPGAKLDSGKPSLYRGLLAYFPRACESVAAVSTFGATKYTWNGWEAVPEGFERYSDAMVRHLTKEGTGETTDRDSNLPHAAHAAWNALARLELLLKK